MVPPSLTRRFSALNNYEKQAKKKSRGKIRSWLLFSGLSFFKRNLCIFISTGFPKTMPKIITKSTYKINTLVFFPLHETSQVVLS